MPSIFSKIINREIPAQVVAEDDRFIAFLDIMPMVLGHTLVVPKKEVDYIYDLDDNELAAIVRSYHAWRGQPGADHYLDEPGFCKTVTVEEVAAAGFALTPGRYVGAAVREEGEEVFDARMAELTDRIRQDFAESTRLTAAVKKALGVMGYEV